MVEKKFNILHEPEPGMVNYEFLDQIDCVGQAGATKVCAFNGSHFNDHANWVMMLKPAFIDFNGKVSFSKFEA